MAAALHEQDDDWGRPAPWSATCWTMPPANGS